MSEAPLKAWLDRGESLLRLRLARPKANIVDHAMIAALTHALNEHHLPGRLRAALIDAEGPHFSFGASVESLCSKLLLTFPDCTIKTIEELRKPKLEAWNRNKENHRAWLALNMMTEARAGFRAFNEGTKDDREIDFVALRQAIAAGEGWTDGLTERIQPRNRQR